MKRNRAMDYMRTTFKGKNMQPATADHPTKESLTEQMNSKNGIAIQFKKKRGQVQLGGKKQ